MSFLGTMAGYTLRSGLANHSSLSARVVKKANERPPHRTVMANHLRKMSLAYLEGSTLGKSWTKRWIGYFGTPVWVLCFLRATHTANGQVKSPPRMVCIVKVNLYWFAFWAWFFQGHLFGLAMYLLYLGVNHLSLRNSFSSQSIYSSSSSLVGSEVGLTSRIVAASLRALYLATWIKHCNHVTFVLFSVIGRLHIKRIIWSIVMRRHIYIIKKS